MVVGHRHRHGPLSTSLQPQGIGARVIGSSISIGRTDLLPGSNHLLFTWESEMRVPIHATAFRDHFTTTWRRTDLLFALVAREAMLSRPISLRHPFIFYAGHLPAFAWNHICRGVLQRSSFNPHFDEVFDRGIDPDVDDPSRCHAHPDVPERWPALEEVIAYRDRVRSAILESIGELVAHAATSLMAERSRVLSMAIEHELMHQETLLYIVQQ